MFVKAYFTKGAADGGMAAERRPEKNGDAVFF